MGSNRINYSIIIPHSNISPLLDRLLGTIPKRDDVQIIVVDDCSNTEELDKIALLKVKYPHVEFYSTETKGGGGKARNVGLKHAVGKFLIFADADDYFNICFNDALDQYKNSDADIIYFSANSVNTDTYENADRAEYFHRIIEGFLSTGDESRIRFGFVVPWGRFIRRSVVYDNNILFAETWVSNDMKFSTESDYYAGKLDADPRAIYCVTDRRGSTSKGQRPDEMLSRLQTEAQRFRFMKEHGVHEHACEASFVNHYARFINTKEQSLIRQAENIMTANQISVKIVKRLYKKMILHQLGHKLLAKLQLARIHS